MNTNEDNYFNYTVLSFTYILFSKLLMHIYKITYIYIATVLTSVAQLRRTFTAKILVGDRMTGDVKRNVTEMHLPATALQGGT